MAYNRQKIAIASAIEKQELNIVVRELVAARHRYERSFQPGSHINRDFAQHELMIANSNYLRLTLSNGLNHMRFKYPEFYSDLV
jgi:hypothetical protein